MNVIQVYKNHKFSSLVVTGLLGTFAFYVAAFVGVVIIDLISVNI